MSALSGTMLSRIQEGNQMTNITNFATKGDTVTAQYTLESSVLLAVYTDPSNRYVYAVDDKEVVRKMSVTRDPQHAKKQFRIAKKLIGKKVRFGVTSGWSSNVWFNEVISAE